MVAAWIRADTGVGPSMASRSQDCSGNWADLPQAASSRARPIQVTVVGSAAPIAASTPSKEKVPRVANIIMIAMLRPRSPTRLTTKAFLAAVAADGFVNQKPISRYEARPTPSQPT